MTPSRPTASPYRPDIDGLRAVSVLAVLLFHAGVAPFSGGFIGVDVFFVVSGYLITGIILHDIGEGRFTIARFYERRVRRIFPALYLTVFVTLAGGLALFAATDLERLFESLAWLAFFASNFYFAENSGYFDAAATDNAILQTWSLAIEEQFYVFFPLLLVGLARARRANLKWVLFGIAVASLIFSIYAVDRDARPAYFSTLARVWELMMGALAAVGFVPPLNGSRLRNAVSLAGIVLVAGSVLLLTVDTPFPGFYALPGCLGALAVIWSGACGQTFVSRCLAWPPLVAVGLISYSLYLLHWPLLVFARYWNRGELSDGQTAAVLALAFGSAWLSWRFVEQPLRKPATADVPRRVLFATAISMMALLGTAGGAGAYWQAGRHTLVEKFTASEKAKALAEPCMIRDTKTFDDWPNAKCTSRGDGEAVAVWGDSFASHYFGAFRRWAAATKRPLMLLAESSCPPIVGLAVPNRPGCAPFNAGAMAWLKVARPAIVVLSADWIVYEKKKSMAELFDDRFTLLQATIDDLRRHGVRVIVLGPSPVFPAPVPRIAADRPEEVVARASYSRRFDQYFHDLARRGDITYFPTFEYFCDRAIMCRYRNGDSLFFWDEGHMTETASERVVRMLTPSLD